MTSQEAEAEIRERCRKIIDRSRVRGSVCVGDLDLYAPSSSASVSVWLRGHYVIDPSGMDADEDQWEETLRILRAHMVLDDLASA